MFMAMAMYIDNPHSFHVVHPAPAGAALSVQYRGRPLVYDGDLAVRPTFMAEQMVGEVGIHWLYTAGEAALVWWAGPGMLSCSSTGTL